MKVNSRKELFFITAIFVVASLCSFISGVYFPNNIPINPIENVKIDDAKDIRFIASNKISKNNYIFQSGYCYSMENELSHSDFYQGSIKLIPTSSYWKYPISEVNSLLYLEKNKKGYISQLILSDKPSIPVVSLIVNPDDFFSYENGIYVQGLESDFLSSKLFYPFPWHRPANYYKKEADKRKIHFSFYDEKGNAKYNSFAMAEINGKATRCFPQKSIRLTANKELGNKKFKYDFFGDNNFYKSLVLRNGGNDNTKALFRDMLMQTMAKESGVITSGFIPCEVYLNGEYWGIHFIQNRIDENFIAEKYQVKEKEITIVETWNLDQGSELEFSKLMNLVKSKKMDLKSVSEVIDIDNLVSFLAAEMYFANTDWPENNLKMYKITDSKKETKWKFVLCDLDYGFGYTGPDAVNMDMFEFLLGKNDLFSKMFQQLMKDDTFKHKLRGELIKLYKNNSSYNINPKMNELYNELKGSIENHTARWGKPATFSDWENEVAVLYDFAKNRGGAVRHQIEKYMK